MVIWTDLNSLVLDLCCVWVIVTKAQKSRIEGRINRSICINLAKIFSDEDLFKKICTFHKIQKIVILAGTGYRANNQAKNLFYAAAGHPS
jgi:hypothetical protein